MRHGPRRDPRAAFEGSNSVTEIGDECGGAHGGRRPRRGLASGTRARFSRPDLVVFADLPLDWERLEGVCMAAAARADLVVRLVASPRFARAAPQALRILPSRVAPDLMLRAGLLPTLPMPRRLLTAAKSSMGAHCRAHRVTRLANALGVHTFTIQHGLECLGISACDAVSGTNVEIAARHVLLWGDDSTIAPAFRVPLAGRTLGIGYLGRRCDPGVVAALRHSTRGCSRPLVLVAENLHWHRYDEHFRSCFMSDLDAVAEAVPDACFVLRPHPAGRFAARPGRTRGERYRLSTEFEQGRSTSLADWAELADAMVTTPSTAALDLALAGKPVAVARYNLGEPWAYHPLPTLARADDWVRFVESLAAGADSAMRAVTAFSSRVCLGRAEPRTVLDRILGAGARE